MNTPTRFAVLLLLLASIILDGCTGSAPTRKTSQAPADSLARASKDLFVKGALSTVGGDYDAAILQFRKVLAAEPENAAVYFSLSKAYVALTVPDSAKHYAEKAVYYNPSNRYYRRLLAGIYFDMKLFSDAATQFEQLAEMEPADARNLFYLAHAYLADEQYERALETFARILQFDPSNESAQAQSLWLELKLKRYGAAIHSLENMMETNGSNDKLQLTLGELYLQSGRPGKALEIFRKMINETPSFVPAWIALFETHIEQGEQELFLKELGRFYAIEEIEFPRKIEVVKLFMLMAEDDPAYSEYVNTMVSELAASRPGDSSVYVLRGMSHRVQKKYKLAQEDFQKALGLEPKKLFAWEELVSTYMAQEQYHHVFRTVSQARKTIGHSSLRLDVFEGYALFRSGAYLKSVKVLEKVDNYEKHESPSWLLVQAHITRAMAYDKLQEQLKSIGAYRDVLGIDPENALALNNLAYLYAERGENLEEAMKYAKQAVDAEPDNPVFLDTLGWLYYKFGEYRKAREIIEKALSMEPDEPEIYKHLVEIYRALGESDKVKEYIDKADELRREETSQKEKGKSQK
ncbi:MAG: tetratricopeptide repeat protein [Chlorobiales bacterium]|nr:tetratricopeptide repeat protein [Chlorobiales bacterium]